MRLIAVTMVYYFCKFDMPIQKDIVIIYDVALVPVDNNFQM